MTKSEMMLQRQLDNSVDSFESYFDNADAAAPVVQPRASGAQVSAVRGNPTFSAQFDLNIMVRYFTVVTATGVYTSILPAALSAGLKTQLPVFLFGHTDYNAGFAKLKQIYTLSGWTYERAIVYGKDFVNDGAGTLPPFDATVKTALQNGDLVQCFSSALPGAGTTTIALVITRCSQVAYGTLLNALSSDRFVMNMIRYILADTTKIAQYANSISMYKQTLFGKFDSDSLSPNSYKKPEQFQAGFIDIPLKWGINKEVALASWINYDVTDLSWSTFVFTVNKLR